ncbi:uncharacterized protein TRIADDRAFT_53619 [Trichoplax adhaerens]|uniref:FZ domain-containing protein n=1 Tax=Trichoplax adhaerens TaxID=10228 RepID=B3RPQ1_TRIAD|nr:predicted protein [Trichoplax adhaerens]EDV28225.1 predicted protein [Trichoplax adhaerens]|eukprot:XP_002110059.1 predicted protein [Trichoplax adhaerens]
MLCIKIMNRFFTPTLTLSEKEALVLGSIFTHSQVELQSGIKCANYFKQIKCNATFPQCSSDRTTLTYVNISNLCAQFRSECSNTSNVPAECTYHRPSEPKSVYNLSACIKPTSALHFHGNDCPPRPKDLTIPEWFNDDRSQLQVIAIHVPDTLRSNGASESCIKKVLSYGCHEIPFCSADRTELLSAGNQQNCQKALTW